jgi:hypothetical protein
MKYLRKFNESNTDKNLSEDDVRNLLVELLDIGFDIKIRCSIGLCKTSGHLKKDIDMVVFLDNLLSFIAKMEYSGYTRIKNEVSVKPLEGVQFNYFEINFKLKDFVRSPSDVVDFETFNDYITNIGFKYSDNSSELDIYDFGNLEVILDEDCFFIFIKNVYNHRDNLEGYIRRNKLEEESDFLLENIALNYEYTSENKTHPYNKDSVEILEKIIKIVK